MMIDLHKWKQKRLTRTQEAGRKYLIDLRTTLHLSKMGQGHEWVVRSSVGKWVLSGWSAGGKQAAIRDAFDTVGGGQE